MSAQFSEDIPSTHDIRFTVAISTYNRSGLVRRAIDSVLRQDYPASEIVVVDDASTDSTAAVIREQYPAIRYLQQPENLGCCAARNRALREAKYDWVVILDDDDTLLPHGLSTIAQAIAQSPDLEKWPVLQFARGNGTIPTGSMVVRFEDYLNGRLVGDFVPAIQRNVFLSHGLQYPETRPAAEHLLWFKVAEGYGIPTWADQVGEVLSDAPVRMTSVTHQIDNALGYAQLQERVLTEFGPQISTTFPSYYFSRLIGAATYRLLAGDRTMARVHLGQAWRRKISVGVVALWALSFLPLWSVRRFYIWYRRIGRQFI